MSSSNNTSTADGRSSSGHSEFTTVIVKKNPVPRGTTYSIMIPWVETSTTQGFLAKILNRLDWGHILNIDMIFKKCQGNKRNHYKVFVHYGVRNPQHKPVFEHLDTTDSELKIWYNDRFFWKVRKSAWKSDSRSDIRLEFGTKQHQTPPICPPPAGQPPSVASPDRTTPASP